MTHEVFISHASDDKSTANAVCHALEEAGIRCWIAPRDVRPGEDWKPAIVSAIKAAEMVVLVFSGEANDSSQVQTEVDMAFEQGHPIVPLRIEDAEMSPRLEYCVGSRHWLDALSDPLEEHIDELVASVEGILRAEGSESTRPSAKEDFEGAPSSVERSGPSSRRTRSEVDPKLKEQVDRLLSQEALRPIEQKLDSSDGVKAARALEASARSLSAEERDRFLWLAVQEEAEQMVDVLLAAGADPNAAVPEDYTTNVDLFPESEETQNPLVEAAVQGSDGIIEKLLTAGADPTSRYEGSPGPLHSAVQQGTVESVRLLLDAGADPSDADHLYGRGSPLCVAARREDPEFIRLMLEANADPDGVRTSQGRTPLHEAVAYGPPETVEMLLEAGADPDLEDHSSLSDDALDGTPLHYAVREGREDVVRLLLEHGADPNIQDRDGETPRDKVGRLSSMDGLLDEYGGERSGWF